jgi:calcium-dependent protein kinase
VKIIEKKSIMNLQDFVKKFEIFKNFNHPNLCRVLEIYEDDGKFYLINELL